MIRPRTTAALGALACVTLGAGIWLNAATAPAEATVQPGTPAFPHLAERLEQAVQVKISHGGQHVALVRTDRGWGIADRGGYPPDLAKLHSMLTGLAELRLSEPRTAEPQFWARLGLDEPAKAEGGATEVRVSDRDGKPIADLLLGHTRTRALGNAPAEVFVRFPGQPQTWLAQGSVPADADVHQWLPREIISIPPEQVTHVSVRRDGADALDLIRNGEHMAVAQPKQHPELDDYKLDDVGRALDALMLQDVEKASALTGRPLGQAEFDTKDGLAVTVALYPGDAKDKTVWATLEVRAADGAPQAASDQAHTLDAKLAGWAFQLGDWQEPRLIPALDDLKKPQPAAK